MRKQRLVVTGAGGFLGSNFIKKICMDDIFSEVIAITLGADEMKDRFVDVKNLLIYAEDAMESGEVVLRNDDILLNCAYPRAMKGSDVTSGLDYVESVFQAAAKAAIKGIINISSQSVYDPQRLNAATEADAPCLMDEYAVGKYCMEMLLRNVCRDIPYTNIRLASLIGPGFDARVPNKMVKNALANQKIQTEINQQHFGYLDVEDGVNGLIGIIHVEPTAWKDVYNLGIDGTYTLLEIAETIRAELKELKDIDIEIIQHEGTAVLNTALDNTRIKSEIGNYRKNDLFSSIRRIIDTM